MSTRSKINKILKEKGWLLMLSMTEVEQAEMNTVGGL